MSSKSWFDHAFPSHAATEQLLRPDLESGLLTQHDFDLAVSFLPGYHRYLPLFHTFCCGATVALFYRFRPKARFPLAVVGVSSVAGYGAGLFHYFHQHKQFARQLDDRAAFLLTLDNVNKRLGNPAPLFPNLDGRKILEQVRKRREEHGETFTPDVLSLALDPGPGMTEGDAPVPMISSGASTKAEAPPAHHKSAWDAIREANAQNTGKSSSWDELRQRHERQRIAQPVQPETTSASALEDPRARAQAEFDAVLEAERKAARD